MRKRKLSPRAVIALVVLGLLFLAVLGYFVLISPQRAEADRLAGEIADTKAKIDEARALSLQARTTERVRVADLFHLSRAMPDQVDMPGVLLEVNRIATGTGIRFDAVTPQAPAGGEGYQALPIEIIFEGNFYDLADFLYRLRNLVSVRSGELAATGRLFTIDRLSFGQGEGGFPRIRATLIVTAYVFGTSPLGTSPAPPAQGETPGPTGTTGTTTTPTETAPEPSAPPALPGGAAAGA